jgi:putative FmdB family regulatory protein
LPTYEYACTACGHRLEAVQKFTDDPLTECPECGAALRKVFGAPGIVLKGSGFYKTDSRAQDKRSGSSDKSSSSNGSSGAESSGSGSESTSAAPAKSDGSSKSESSGSGGSGSDKPAKESASKPAATTTT